MKCSALMAVMLADLSRLGLTAADAGNIMSRMILERILGEITCKTLVIAVMEFWPISEISSQFRLKCIAKMYRPTKLAFSGT